MTGWRKALADLAAAVAGLALSGLVVVCAVALYPLMGAFAAAVLAWLFPETMTGLMGWLGWDLAAWQMGFCMGFVSAFLKASVSKE